MVIYFLKMSLTRDITYPKTETLAKNNYLQRNIALFKRKKIFKRKHTLHFSTI